VVTGSDEEQSEVTRRLATKLGVAVFEGHSARHVGDADVVVVSSAVRAANPEVAEAAKRGIAVIPRAEMLAELMRMRFSIAVTGSHGKTTVTSMIAFVLERGGLDPDAVIGGRLSAFGSNARLGRGEYMVAEADESDRSFLLLSPSIAVITNIDHEHLEAYGGFQELQQAFVDFGNKVPFYGCVIACTDDPPVAEVATRIKRRLVTYGLEDVAAQFSGTDIEVGAFGGRCVVQRRRGETTDRLGTLELSVPGRHNLRNALGARAVAAELGLSFKQAADALRQFEGAERRFQRYGEAGGVLVVDDYAHHPTEIAAVLSAARATLKRRIVVAFQPHRYTRTQQLLRAFGPALAEADEIFLTDIYPASEEPIAGVTVDALADAVRQGSGRPVRVIARLDDLAPALLDAAKPGDAILTLGAGSIATLPKRLVDLLRQREARA
jgi:UDP-N-acetylmuramate--alanine ligase